MTKKTKYICDDCKKEITDGIMTTVSIKHRLINDWRVYDSLDGLSTILPVYIPIPENRTQHFCAKCKNKKSDKK